MTAIRKLYDEIGTGITDKRVLQLCAEVVYEAWHEYIRNFGNPKWKSMGNFVVDDLLKEN